MLKKLKKFSKSRLGEALIYLSMFLVGIVGILAYQGKIGGIMQNGSTGINSFIPLTPDEIILGILSLFLLGGVLGLLDSFLNLILALVKFGIKKYMEVRKNV